MSLECDFSVVPPHEVRAPAEQRIPFVFDSPHSGRYYPSRFLASSRLDEYAIRRSEDCYVEELFGAAVALGAPMLLANFPRAYLDVNREPYELDPRMFAEPLPPYANAQSARVAGGLGTVPRLVGEGQDIYPGKLPLTEALERIETLYKPYHAVLSRLIADTQRRFGYCVLIDCHSMPAGIKVGDGIGRPDFIIGDRFGMSCSDGLSAAAIELLRDMGYAVAHNKPYAGGYITEHYGRPTRGFHALQIEVNRGLYLNERTFAKHAGFELLRKDIDMFLADLSSLPDYHFGVPPLAAE
ncbi:N-formylglutamate amidohydrolase [Phyllobacterium salinisoli]|uniref:N-formylglutamate amidohydrolase n=1 Tax=Phyllobacterium salinisoli TaxID=1899321 RepID=A0A368K3Y9_9HYPH|nr:N-formylglutamate amidohydrolase [Phyllobacterium salinisoli]RCS23914.1 N-formylglutamate amidohydrolase [Phyllobacterium salinisoli]